jgi:hypothetical protein
MIGVIAESGDQEVVSEFFELFKTPWEFHRTGQSYDVVLCAAPIEFDGPANMVVYYAGKRTPFDDRHGIQTGPQRREDCILSYRADRIPVYGDTVPFPCNENALLTDGDGQCVALLERVEERAVARVGYDLFGEIRRLLTDGQPETNAGLPALELHIAFLRNLITDCGVPLAEIPPVPEGYRFVACLTHDVDHPSIRRHKWDHTTFGFLYRAVFGSLVDFVRGRMSVRSLFTNWLAAGKLPFVQLGLAKDFWREFGDRYLEIEQGVRSTFFVIPFQNRPGKKSDGPAPTFRAARYGAHDIADTIRRLQVAGCEVALHGIDAWFDSSKGREEIEEIRRLTGAAETGVRMHWLYNDRQSPKLLEIAGAVYDSTMGYSGTVGFRAGTTQAYKPLEAKWLIELPLHIMDTALFYPAHLGLSSQEARTRIGGIVDTAVQFGGCVTVNWHDRSLAPERLWGDCYRELLQDLKARGAWFATVGEATAWFRKRRLAIFEMDCGEPDRVRARISADSGNRLPGLQLRFHKARKSFEIEAVRAKGYVDMALDESPQMACRPCSCSKAVGVHYLSRRRER